MARCGDQTIIYVSRHPNNLKCDQNCQLERQSRVIITKAWSKIRLDYPTSNHLDPGAITSKCIFIRHCNAVKSRYSVLDDHWPPTPIRKSPICGLVMDIICRTKRFITPATAPPTQPPRRAVSARRESRVLPCNYTTINTGTYGKPMHNCIMHYMNAGPWWSQGTHSFTP